MRWILVALMLVVPIPSMAQFDIPDIPKPGDIEIPIKIPGLDKILRQEPTLSTSFEDATTGVPFLDDFEPPVLAPMTEVPRGRSHSFMLGPGGYEAVLESYCLHAGTHGPGKGEGYLWAPLKGPVASIISHILRNAAAHPEVEQRNIQVLIWGILARTKISDMSDELQDAAGALLTAREIRRLNGGALGQIPRELMDQAFGELPPAVRQILEAEARIRGMLSEGVSDFDAIEGVAVLPGDPPPDENAEDTPRSRWSYKPGGFFVRYSPSGYSRTRTQVFVPPPISIEEDEFGRITAIADRSGNRIETEYDDETDAPSVGGDDGVAGHAFSSIRIVSPDRQDPVNPLTAELTDVGWVLIGTPSGDGRPERTAGRFSDLAERYEWAASHARELSELAETVRKVGRDPAPEDMVQELLPAMVDLASYSEAIRQAAEGNIDDEWASAPLSLPKQAWMVGLAAIGDGISYAEEGTATVAGEPGRPSYFDRVLLASAELGPILLAESKMEPMERPRFSDPWGLERERSGGGRRGKPLKPFKPGGDDDDDADAAQPADDRQRLGQSNRPSGDGNGKDVLEKAKTAIGLIGKGKQIVDAVTNPVGTIVGQVGFGIQDQMQAGYFDWLFGTAAEISQQLGGDPPRDDFDILEMLEEAAAGAGETVEATDMPPERAAALQALMDSLVHLVGTLRAGQVSIDRLGGAVEADDEEWEQKQSAALMEYKRASGEAFIQVADRLDALLDELANEGINDIIITAEAYRAYQDRLRTEGFTPEEIQAGHLAGLTDAEMEASRQERIGLDPEEAAGSLIAGGREAAAAMRELGYRWSALAEYDVGLVGLYTAG